MHNASEENPAVSQDLEEEESKEKSERSKTPLMVSESQELDRNAVNCWVVSIYVLQTSSGQCNLKRN